jgi:hypothetical protein
MFSTKSKTGLMLFVFSLLMIFAGLSYLLYLNVVFPGLVPSYGSGERFTLSEAENYSLQMPWLAYSKLHLALRSNDNVKLYVDSEYMCDCTSYDFVVEPGEQVLVLLESDAPVSGMFTAWQEIPFEKQILALTLVIIGLLGIGIILTGKLR